LCCEEAEQLNKQGQSTGVISSNCLLLVGGRLCQYPRYFGRFAHPRLFSRLPLIRPKFHFITVMAFYTFLIRASASAISQSHNLTSHQLAQLRRVAAADDEQDLE